MWPKFILVRGLTVPVHSWEELDQVISRYGTVESSPPRKSQGKTASKGPSLFQSTTARTDNRDENGNPNLLLKLFVDSGRRGLLNKVIRQALGMHDLKKTVGPELEKWSRKVGLLQNGETLPFQQKMFGDGRGYRLEEKFFEVANSLLKTR